jgi:hypothetical protein
MILSLVPEMGDVSFVHGAVAVFAFYRQRWRLNPYAENVIGTVKLYASRKKPLVTAAAAFAFATAGCG